MKSRNGAEAVIEIISMRKIIGTPAGIAILLLLSFGLNTGCDRRKDAMIDELVALEDESYNDQKISESTIEELEESIAALEVEVSRTIDAGERLITYYKMVAIRYMERELFGFASEFYKKALDIQPGNRLLAYRLGVCVAQVALSKISPAERLSTLEEAEAYYQYALRLDPAYDEALYAISVLYIFELERSLDAEPYLIRLLDEESRHFQGMFLLARVYVEYGRIEDAVALYEEVIRESGNSTQVGQAERNRAELLGGVNGS